MGLADSAWRRLKVISVALVIYLDYKIVQRRIAWTNNEKKNILWEKAHERNAKRVLSLILELKGLWVKFGQYLSTRADVIPDAYVQLLKQLQDSLPPRPLREVQKTIQKELGKTMDGLFSNFVETPLATASIAQVHRATLQDGREVIVKVQHEGIKEIILVDLKNAKSIIDWIAWAEPQYNFGPLIDEWCREAPKELDFNHEAENTISVSRNLCSSKGGHNEAIEGHAVNILIPEVIQSTEKVLILEYMDGIRLNDKEGMEALHIDLKKRIVEEITRAYAHQIYIDGFFNGDPHPGNFLVSREPPHRPILLDFGLTKSISNSMKQALAKMFLACAEGNHVALLSSFAEMGLKLRLDMPEQAMDVATIFFRTTIPANESLANVESLSHRREKNMKALQEKFKLNEKDMKRFNPVDAFPGDAIIFARVLSLLRGLSATLGVRIVYLDIMKPFAESALLGRPRTGPAMNTNWICSTPIHSAVEDKLRKLLAELGNEKVLGLQVCAYKNGEVVIDTTVGVLGKYDPRPVQPDSLFPVFSVTKGVTSGMVHWLVDKGKLRLDETISNIWPEFRTNNKDLIKVHHVLNHTSGLHNAMAGVMKTEPLLVCNWEESLNKIAMSVPETEPGSQQLYHYLSFGWLCGGIVEHASGKKFQEVLEEAIIHPLKMEGELYVGIPPGVESRLASLSVDMGDMEKLSELSKGADFPDSLVPQDVVETLSAIPTAFNTLNIRRAIIPAANGHCSARALARYYAALARGGIAPPPHSSHSQPPLGTHAHIPNFPLLSKKKNKSSQGCAKDLWRAIQSTRFMKSIGIGSRNLPEKEENGPDTSKGRHDHHEEMFSNPNIHAAFMGIGEYENFVHPQGKFGLGFRRLESHNDEDDGGIKRAPTCFGHSGIGGSTGFCDVEHDFAIAVTVNQMSLGRVVRRIVQLVCSELNVPVPDEFRDFGPRAPEMQLRSSLLRSNNT